MIEMCLGFLFDCNYKHVLLLKKRRPEWQAGLYNGVGGHLEAVDQGLPFKAMCREAEEEVGVQTIGWRPYAVMEIMMRMPPAESERFAETKRIHVFACVNDHWMSKFKQLTDEEPQVFRLVPSNWRDGVDDIDYLQCIPNLRWLLQMAQDISIDPVRPIVVQVT